ncbi:MarR family winged helix-turn-helix transcriptional regulator [Actibacterium pelagium]|uniref:HTH marR-type domain-containing protein n=1 Tax=Actibacterium pelagium TaxID=2029103 RepID=A0A917AN88_9RHOB|nr:MarR family winged helix-turn-helix transcriptional regulator [Actibacterium pelagium]GGE62267.1 hypothetical protein GCM10011517_32440 [Actibacterium pelagium]
MTLKDKPITDPGDDSALTPEIRAIMGVYSIFTQIQSAIEAIEAEDGMTDPARRLLIRLDRPYRMGELARITRLLPSTVTAQVDVLEGLELVERQRDPTDRRAWVLSLTSKGETLREELVHKAGQLFHEVTGFDEAETKAFAALTDKARKHIIDTILDGSPSC